MRRFAGLSKLLAAVAVLAPSLAFASLPRFTSTREDLAADRAFPSLALDLPAEDAPAHADEAPSPFADLKTRVRGFDLALHCGIGGEQGVTCGTRRASGFSYDGLASDISVFTGYFFSKSTNLYFAKARWYDPEIARFTTQDDPAFGKVDDPPSLHLYFYANANPTRYIDPTGHQTAPANENADILEDAKQQLEEADATNPQLENYSGDEDGAINGTVAEQGQAPEQELGWQGPGASVLNWAERKLGEFGEWVSRPFRKAGAGSGVIAKVLVQQASSRPSEHDIQQLKAKYDLIKDDPTVDAGLKAHYRTVLGQAGVDVAAEVSQAIVAKGVENGGPVLLGAGISKFGGAVGDLTESVGSVLRKAGSAEHRAARWAEYQARGGQWNYERWSKVYEGNMTRATRANQAADEFHKTLSWGTREVTVDVEGVPRRLDIGDKLTLRGWEVKTGKQSLTQDNLWEIQRDAILRDNYKWDVRWRFEGPASAPLRKALADAGIPYTGGTK